MNAIERNNHRATAAWLHNHPNVRWYRVCLWWKLPFMFYSR